MNSMRLTVPAIFAIGIIAILFAAGCADIRTTQKAKDFGTTFGASAEQQKLIDWFKANYGDPTTNNNDPPRFVLPMVTTGLTQDNMPMDNVQIFPKDGGSVYFLVVYDNFKKGDPINVKWVYLVNGNEIASVDQQAGDDFGRLIVEIQKPTSGWGVGKQEITVTGRGATEKVDFEIGAEKQTASLPWEGQGPGTLANVPAGPAIKQPTTVTVILPVSTGTGSGLTLKDECGPVERALGWFKCPDGCRDILNDPTNCGYCGHKCGEKTLCTGGNCMPLLITVPLEVWTGVWMLKYGDRIEENTQMNLVQAGNTVTGTYDYQDGTITGTVQGDRLIGTWNERDVEHEGIPTNGPFEYVIAGDGMTFSGWVDVEGADFDATKNGPVTDVGSRALGLDTFTWTGTWGMSYYGLHTPADTPMNLVQVGNTVTGTYDISEGTITGTVQGGRLRGYWTQDNVVGTYAMELVMIDNGMKFYGWSQWPGDGRLWEDTKALEPEWNGTRVSW